MPGALRPLRGVTRRASRLLVILLALMTVGCDHVTKVAAARRLAAHPLQLFHGMLDLRYTENHDVAFSALSRLAFPGKDAILLALSAVLTLGVGVAWWRARSAPVARQLALALVAAGALGNVLDRAMRGYVVDFIHLAHWPVFNVADTAIVAGGLLWALSRHPPRTAEASPQFR